jgi:uncharacterized protein
MLRDDRAGGEGRRQAARNVLGEALEICSISPMTGFYRDGCCNTGREDMGSHTVCAVMTSAFLEFSKSRGNDLSTPLPELGFPGLKPGDRWCLCAPRWQEAFEASQAPRVVLRATHEGALVHCSLADLKRFAWTWRNSRRRLASDDPKRCLMTGNPLEKQVDIKRVFLWQRLRSARIVA